MQQLHSLLHSGGKQAVNLYDAMTNYQIALSLLLMKLHKNPILPEVQNNILTRLMSERLNQLMQADLFDFNRNVERFQSTYNQMLRLSNDYFHAWNKSSRMFLESFGYEKNDNIQSCTNNFLNIFQTYQTNVFKMLEENVKRAMNDYFQDDSDFTAKFIYDELTKLLHHKNIPYLNFDFLNDTSHENLLKGSQMFLKDVQNSPDGYFIIDTVNRNAFEIGKNIAATKGKVVFRNRLIELICYENTTENVYKTPVLIVTAWINKYYVLDLDVEHSYVRWLVNQGYRVFITSWINPDKSLANANLNDYLQDGLIAAIHSVKECTGVQEINCIGYCMGGTLLAIGAAYLASKGIQDIQSITLLTALTDFERCGPVKVFITDEMLRTIEEYMEKQGYISGYDMFTTFSLIKSNDMIWNYFVNKYVLGKESRAIDVLYWNSDSTRIPYALHKQCLRDLYQNNLLANGKWEVNNTKIDLSTIKCPIYCFATEDDHIAPWQGVYKGLQLFKNASNKRFVLSKSGHVAAVINHPNKNKYGYWFNVLDKKSKKLPELSDDWLQNASYESGSWWNDWHKWTETLGLRGTNIPSISIPNEKILCDAPGEYIKL